MNGVHVFADEWGHWWWQPVFVWVPECEPVGPFNRAVEAVADSLPERTHDPRPAEAA